MGLEKICRFECVNAFDVLKNWTKEDKRWDVVMLDPPSFTKSRSTIDKAVAGYKEINLRGMKLVKPGGFFSNFQLYQFSTTRIIFRHYTNGRQRCQTKNTPGGF